MAQPYVGEIRIFAGNFPPAGWEFCEGQLLPISEYETLFQLIGTMYGGDGQSTYGLPDLRGRIPIHQGNGKIMAEAGGVETVTLVPNQIPAHTHSLYASASPAVSSAPSENVLAQTTFDLYRNVAAAGTFPVNSLQQAGGSQPHENMQPYLCLNFIISLYGIFPSPT